MSYVLSVGMFAHVILQSGVVLERVRTSNPIWGELAAMFAAYPIFVLWGLLGTVLKGAM